MKATVSDQDVREYVADCAESIIEDDTNESEEWTDSAHEELQQRAYLLLDVLRGGEPLEKLP